MANTIARARGFRANGRPQAAEATRLGHGAAEAEANTWRTMTKTHVEADGSGFVVVTRDGETIHFHRFGPEAAARRDAA